MNKRERITKTIAGEATDRPPTALWRHWPGDDQRAADFAHSTIAFQREYDWDFVRIVPAESFSVTDYGLQDEWQGSPDGRRVIIRRVIQRSLDWTDLRPLDPNRGTMGRQVEATRLICDGLRHDETPIIHTIYSPLAQAEMVAGKELLRRHLRTQPDRIQTGLNTLTESTLRFIDSLKKQPIDGIAYVIRHADYDELAEEEYRTYGLPYDRKVLESLPDKWWFNSIQVEGKIPMFRNCAQLPSMMINWEDQSGEPDLSQAKLIFNGAMCGGLSSREHLHHGTPAAIREQVRLVRGQVNNRRLIVSSGSLMLLTTPLSNIRAVREAVTGVGG